MADQPVERVTYRATVGIDLKKVGRIEAGEQWDSDTKPPAWLLEQGLVEIVVTDAAPAGEGV